MASSSHTDPPLIVEDGWHVCEPVSEDEWEVVSAKSYEFEPPSDPLLSVTKGPSDPLLPVTNEPEQVTATCLPMFHWCSSRLSKWDAATGKEVPSRMMKPSKHNKFFRAIICPACMDKQYKIMYTQ